MEESNKHLVWFQGLGIEYNTFKKRLNFTGSTCRCSSFLKCIWQMLWCNKSFYILFSTKEGTASLQIYNAKTTSQQPRQNELRCAHVNMTLFWNCVFAEIFGSYWTYGKKLHLCWGDYMYRSSTKSFEFNQSFETDDVIIFIQLR